MPLGPCVLHQAHAAYDGFACPGPWNSDRLGPWSRCNFRSGGILCEQTLLRRLHSFTLLQVQGVGSTKLIADPFLGLRGGTVVNSFRRSRSALVQYHNTWARGILRAVGFEVGQSFLVVRSPPVQEGPRHPASAKRSTRALFFRFPYSVRNGGRSRGRQLRRFDDLAKGVVWLEPSKVLHSSGERL